MKKEKRKKKMVAKIKHCYSNYDYCEEKARKCTCKKVCGDYVTVLPSKDFFFLLFFFGLFTQCCLITFDYKYKNAAHLYCVFNYLK